MEAIFYIDGNVGKKIWESLKQKITGIENVSDEDEEVGFIGANKVWKETLPQSEIADPILPNTENMRPSCV